MIKPNYFVILTILLCYNWNSILSEEITTCGCLSSRDLNSKQSETVVKQIFSNTNHDQNQNDFGSSSEVAYSKPEADDTLVFVKNGSFYMGTDNPIIGYDGEGPRRKVYVNSFYINKFATTNNDFAEFVNKTNFVTESEIFGWSFVFESAVPPHIKRKITKGVLGAEWWLPVNHSYWREPEGKGTDVFTTDRGKYPVVQISWNDAVAYCKWKNMRLPTEAEWEYAARGGAGGTPSLMFPWGNKLTPHNQHRANIFQGTFPGTNTAEDGYEFLSPVDAFPPQNKLGLHDMIGNVWEWVEDWWTIDHSAAIQQQTIPPSLAAPAVSMEEAIEGDGHDPRGEGGAGGDVLYNPRGPLTGTEKTKKGGSFLCHKSYCYRYRNAARHHATPDSATLNGGFRCVRDAASAVGESMDSNAGGTDGAGSTGSGGSSDAEGSTGETRGAIDSSTNSEPMDEINNNEL